MTNYDKIFNSQRENNSKIELANGYISTTKILFEAESMAIRIDAKGVVDFLDLEDQVIASINIAEQTGGKKVYTEILCRADDGSIQLKFPVVEWIDHYPNCDGEHDRWDSRIIGCHELVFDLKTSQIIFTAFNN